jgi:hypothetical protein
VEKLKVIIVQVSYLEKYLDLALIIIRVCYVPTKNVNLKIVSYFCSGLLPGEIFGLGPPNY